MSLACPTKYCTHSELPENGFCKMKVCLKLLVENSISCSVSRQKVLNMLENEHIQLYLLCIILHIDWIWVLTVLICGFFDKKVIKLREAWETERWTKTCICSYKLEATIWMQSISQEKDTSDSHGIISYHSIFQTLSNSFLGKFLQFNDEKQPIYMAQDECQSGAESPTNKLQEPKYSYRHEWRLVGNTLSEVFLSNLDNYPLI